MRSERLVIHGGSDLRNRNAYVQWSIFRTINLTGHKEAGTVLIGTKSYRAPHLLKFDNEKLWISRIKAIEIRDRDPRNHDYSVKFVEGMAKGGRFRYTIVRPNSILCLLVWKRASLILKSRCYECDTKKTKRTCCRERTGLILDLISAHKEK